MTKEAAVALYARVSTSDQNPEAQLQELRQFAERRGWPVVREYQEVESGTRTRRPVLAQLLADARNREFGCLLVWKLDRFGRSLLDCLDNLRLLDSYSVRFVAATQGIDTDESNSPHPAF